MLARSHMTSPAGAATAAALPSTKTVLSMSERMMMLPGEGFLYGGSSRINDEGIPFRNVIERNLETTRVMMMPRIMKSVIIMPAKSVESADAPAVKNTVMIPMRAGKPPFIRKETDAAFCRPREPF